MVIKSAALETVCGITSKLPQTGKPEIAFAGKSNVGKSSLINGLMNRKSLARTSSQPGKTQTINYYNVNGCIYFVDLPGYGYAKVPVKDKDGKRVKEVVDGKKVTQYETVEKEIKKDQPSRLHVRRKILSVLYPVVDVPVEAAGRKRNTKEVDLVAKLFEEYGPKYADRKGGYTRIVKIGPRKGDAAMEVILELV